MKKKEVANSENYQFGHLGSLRPRPQARLKGRNQSGWGLGCGLTPTGTLLACAPALVVTGAWCGQGAQFIILGQAESSRRRPTTSSPGK